MALKSELVEENIKKLLSQYIKEQNGHLPTEARLCDMYSVSRQTVRVALKSLEEAGYIVRRQGSGIYATGLLPENAQNNVAVMLPSASEYIYPSIIEAVDKALVGTSFKRKLYISENSRIRELSLLSDLLNNPPRVLVIMPIRSALIEFTSGLSASDKYYASRKSPDFMQLINKLAAQGTVIISLLCRLNTSFAHYIDTDHENDTYYLTRHLINLGMKQVAVLLSADEQAGIKCYQGYIQATSDDTHIGSYTVDNLTHLRQQGKADFIDEFISDKLSLCDAVICDTDEIAYYLVKGLKKRDIRIPQDISVLSLNTTYMEKLIGSHVDALTYSDDSLTEYLTQTIDNAIHVRPVESRILPMTLRP